MSDSVKLYNIKLKLPADWDNDLIGSITSGYEEALAVTAQRDDNKYNGAWTVTWLSDHLIDCDNIIAWLAKNIAPDFPIQKQDFTIEDVPDVNWLEHCYQEFQPFAVGPFYIYGSHYEGDLPGDKNLLQIDAALAFGSGEHGTTKGCLLALEYLQQEEHFAPKSILDMGTGSGILAIGAAQIWPESSILAIDIEEDSVRVTNHHAALNNVQDMIVCYEGDGFNAPQVQEQKPFELVIANILAGPLREMAPDLAVTVTEGGIVILSGLLEEQAGEILRIYGTHNIELLKRWDTEGWVALLLRKEAA